MGGHVRHLQRVLQRWPAYSRKFADGTDLYTLPVMQDTATGSTVADSFEIAIYV